MKSIKASLIMRISSYADRHANCYFHSMRNLSTNVSCKLERVTVKDFLQDQRIEASADRKRSMAAQFFKKEGACLVLILFTNQPLYQRGPVSHSRRSQCRFQCSYPDQQTLYPAR